ncbi:MAG: type II toxin-antitoxin system Phd/YefM family antitoxin [Proteobacteria bacterium]|nr:type II toxin-antitoxin system Phd/YefM family antitoxin [Desulfobacteraceae bacterium]MBU2522485.1 type II toxin-antitoxin system Phd/YefM family antitoxin [Pseudomonadota bacterium]MBU3980388.1 type II toxin-antitoxin system Phd/YefM family antitoxin [Pseudomonadota bacterium]MBU4014037.1 type II toxin-antitoxin system Phd/YefM family antitoxin [Pseudomonadota bacterium]MBU4066857.1 type II toxin-antitoxin system Phd/YefM family antitoxin [Pseudomonadota bacterium]
MKIMAISKFKAHALKILDEVAESQEKVVITKRGKPLAEVIPYQRVEGNSKPGKLADAFVFEKDIVSPLGEEIWDACK